MPRKVRETEYQCTICNTTYTNPLMAVSCERSHDVIYVPLYIEDIRRLVQFMFTRDEKLIPERMMKTLMSYTRSKPKKERNDLP